MTYIFDNLNSFKLSNIEIEIYVQNPQTYVDISIIEDH